MPNLENNLTVIHGHTIATDAQGQNVLVVPLTNGRHSPKPDILLGRYHSTIVAATLSSPSSIKRDTRPDSSSSHYYPFGDVFRTFRDGVIADVVPDALAPLERQGYKDKVCVVTLVPKDPKNYVGTRKLYEDEETAALHVSALTLTCIFLDCRGNPFTKQLYVRG